MQARFDSWRTKVNADSETEAATIVPAALLPSLGAAVDTAYAALKNRVSLDELAGIMGRLAVACKGQSADNERMVKARAAMHLQYLGDYPGDVIALAADEWIRGNVWFPAISELRAICDRIQGERTRIWNRLKRAHQASWEAERQRQREAQIAADLADPEKRAMVDRALADAKARLMQPAPAPRRPTRANHVTMTDEERDRALANVRPGVVPMKARA